MKVEKAQKAEKWKNIKIPESLWIIIKVAAAKKGMKLYKELQSKYENS